MQIVDGKEDYVWLNMEEPYFKTVIDTSKISIEDAEKLAKQAFSNSNIELIKNKNNSYSLRLNGVSNDGIEFEGWIDMDKWEVNSFYPIN